MTRYRPVYYRPPRRGYGGGGGRSPPRRGYGGGRREQNHGSLLVRNIPLDCRPEELRVPFERFGPVRDVYIPKDYHTGEPRGFAFVQFVDSYDASEAQYHMNRQIFAGREISVVAAAETRKRPEEMRQKSRIRGPVGYEGQRSSYYVSRLRSPHSHPGSRSQHRLRSFSPVPRQQGDYPVSPRRHAEYPKSPRSPLEERDDDQKCRSYSSGYRNDTDFNQSHGYGKKAVYESEAMRGQWRSPPHGTSRSPVGSRLRSADLSPRYGR